MWVVAGCIGLVVGGGLIISWLLRSTAAREELDYYAASRKDGFRSVLAYTWTWHILWNLYKLGLIDKPKNT